MAIISDGTQAFGVESPLTINAITYVCEGLTFSFTGQRVDINSSDGEPLGSTTIPGRTEVTGTLQLAADSTESRVRGQTFVISATNADLDGTYLITDCSEAQSQGEYRKVSITGYKQIN